MKKIWIAVGGSGGHLFPAQVLAKELQNIGGYQILFVGEGLGSSSFFDRSHFSYQEIPAASLKGSIKAKIVGLTQNIKGTVQSVKMLKKQKPDLVIGFGSFHSFSPLAAALLSKTPFVLFECNSVMGKVNRLFKEKALVCYHSLFDLNLKGCETIKVKMPLSKQKLSKVSKESALQRYQLKNDLFTFLIFGGSQGAMSLNQKVFEVMGDLKQEGYHFQVIHFLGPNTDLEGAKKIYSNQGIAAFVAVFEEKMEYAFALADVAITRSGASTLAEMLYHQIPTLFIPYPYVEGDHQRHNAEYFVKKIKYFDCLVQKEANRDIFCSKLKNLMKIALACESKVDVELERDCKTLAQAIDGSSLWKNII